MSVRDKVREALQDSAKISERMGRWLGEVRAHRIEITYGIVEELYKTLTDKETPLLKVNALFATQLLLETVQHEAVQTVQNFLLPLLQEGALYQAERNSYDRTSQYFKEKGYPPTIANLEQLSHNYVLISTEIIFFGAFLKPNSLFFHEQMRSLSSFKQSALKLTAKGIEARAKSTEQERRIKSLRKTYLEGLADFQRHEVKYVGFFKQKIKKHLKEGGKNRQLLDWRRMLKSGDSFLTSELIGFLTEGLEVDNFLERRHALGLIAEFVVWGDMEAIMIINQGQVVEKIAERVGQVAGNLDISKGVNIYPQIVGQAQQKRGFYIQFLRSIETWAKLWPISTYAAGEESQVHLIYRELKDSRGFMFPPNDMFPKQLKEFEQSMRRNEQRNQLIIQQLTGNESSLPMSKNSQRLNSKYSQKISLIREMRQSTILSFSELERLVEQSEHALRQLPLSEQESGKQIKMLTRFAKQFQQKLGTLQEEVIESRVENLYGRGYRCIETLNELLPLYKEYQIGKTDFAHFAEAAEKRISQVELLSRQKSNHSKASLSRPSQVPSALSLSKSINQIQKNDQSSDPVLEASRASKNIVPPIKHQDKSPRSSVKTNKVGSSFHWQKKQQFSSQEPSQIPSDHGSINRHPKQQFSKVSQEQNQINQTLLHKDSFKKSQIKQLQLKGSQNNQSEYKASQYRGIQHKGSSYKQFEYNGSQYKESQLKKNSSQGNHFQGSSFRASEVKRSQMKGNYLKVSQSQGILSKSSQIKGNSYKSSSIKESAVKEVIQGSQDSKMKKTQFASPQRDEVAMQVAVVKAKGENREVFSDSSFSQFNQTNEKIKEAIEREENPDFKILFKVKEQSHLSKKQQSPEHYMAVLGSLTPRTPDMSVDKVSKISREKDNSCSIREKESHVFRERDSRSERQVVTSKMDKSDSHYPPRIQRSAKLDRKMIISPQKQQIQQFDSSGQSQEQDVIAKKLKIQQIQNGQKQQKENTRSELSILKKRKIKEIEQLQKRIEGLRAQEQRLRVVRPDFRSPKRPLRSNQSPRFRERTQEQSQGDIEQKDVSRNKTRRERQGMRFDVVQLFRPPQGRLVYTRVYRRGLDQVVGKQRKRLLRNKQLVIRTDELQIGLTVHKDRGAVKVIYYVTARKFLRTFLFKVDPNSRIAVHVIPATLGPIEPQKQYRLYLFGQVLEFPYTLPKIHFRYHHDLLPLQQSLFMQDCPNTYTSIVPLFFTKFLNFVVSDPQIIKDAFALGISNILRGPEQSYSRKLLPRPHHILEYFPEFMLLEKNEWEWSFGAECSFGETHFFLKLIIKINKFAYIQGIIDDQTKDKGNSEKVVEYAICCLERLLGRDQDDQFE